MDSKSIYILLVKNKLKDAELLQQRLVEVGAAQWRAIQVSRLLAALKCIDNQCFDVTAFGRVLSNPEVLALAK